jgi:hypothetical protein
MLYAMFGILLFVFLLVAIGIAKNNKEQQRQDDYRKNNGAYRNGVWEHNNFLNQERNQARFQEQRERQKEITRENKRRQEKEEDTRWGRKNGRWFWDE